MPAIQVNEATYFYRRQGNGPPLLLLHGFTGSSKTWLPLIAELETEMDVVAVDLLGHGQSARPETIARYAIEAAAADIVRIMRELGCDSFHLLGYSMGGRLALYTARYYPQLVLTLQLESSSPGIASENERLARRHRDAELADAIEQKGIAPFVQLWESLPLFASQEMVPQTQRDSLRQQRLRNDPRGLANSLRGMGTGVQPSLWEELPYVTMPVQLICGSLDKKFLAINERMVQLLKNARLTKVPDAGHTVHFERPRQFAALVERFLRTKHPR